MRCATAWLSALGLAAVAGCADAPPFVAPDVALPARLTSAPLPAATAGGPDATNRAQSLAGDRLACGAWWHGFGDPRVDELVAHALAGNPTIGVAQAQLRQAHELALAQAATLWPSADVGVAAVRTHGANASLVDNSAPGARTALLSASYSPDVFGALARSVESSQAQEDAARFELQATKLALAGAVIDALVAEDAAVREQQLLTRLVGIDADVLAIVDARQALGDVATSAAWAQRQQLHDRKSALASAELQLAQSRDLLASLEGRLPADVASQSDSLSLTLPDIPARLTGAAILQRPDVRMAGAQLHAADASLEAALASRLPQVALTADAGYAVGIAGALFNPLNVVWDVGASVTQSLFDAGARRHQSEAARAVVEAQEAQYRATAIAAFKDVADALEAVRRDAEADAEATERATASRRQWDIAIRGEALGDLSRQDVLAAQSQLLQNEALQVQTRAARLADAAEALVALGGAIDDAAPPACGVAASSP
jgi:NodT family efflux transporter outer membrane factor (OMF) lipoprotein